MRRKILRLALFFSKCNLSHWCQPALLMILLGEQVLWMSDGIKEWNNNIFLYILMLSMGILLSMKMTMVSYHNSRRKIMRGNCHHWSFITVYYYHHYYYYILSIYLWRYYLFVWLYHWVESMAAAESSQVQAITWKNFFFFSLAFFNLRLKWIPKIFLNHFFGICL